MIFILILCILNVYSVIPQLHLYKYIEFGWYTYCVIHRSVRVGTFGGWGSVSCECMWETKNLKAIGIKIKIVDFVHTELSIEQLLVMGGVGRKVKGWRGDVFLNCFGAFHKTVGMPNIVLIIIL